MGQRNSSLTRVVPVFDALMDRDSTGRSWLPALLKLGSRFPGRLAGMVPGLLIQDHQRWWGRNEFKLDPPKALLGWLVQNLNKPKSERFWGGEEAKTNRERLVGRDPDIIKLALHLLEEEIRPRAWYVLEGRSRPDALLQTENTIIVIEGKRTERQSTTTTTWMPLRSQMLRHMDAAWEVKKGKTVLGLMIVEGTGRAEGLEPSPYWLTAANAQIENKMLENSLPHRTPEERAAIADGFLGITTWQRVCLEFRLPWPPILEAG